MSLLLALIVVLFSQSLFSQELEPIVFSSKQQTLESEFVGSVETISADEIDSYGVNRAQDILNQVAGVEVNQTGVIGGQSTIFIRGAESRHTLVMIDGVKMYDTASISRSFNLSLLNLLDIEKIEVLKGSQSVLYGSDAIGGVINIITKKGEQNNKLTLASGYMKQAAASYTKDLEHGLLHFNGYYQQVDDFDDVKDGDEKDLKINKGFTLNTNLNFNKLESNTTFKLSSDYSETDASDFATDLPIDDEISFARVTQYLLKQSFNFSLDNESSLSLDYSFSKHDRLNSTSSDDLNYDGTLIQSEVRYNTKWERTNLVLGTTQIKETYTDNNISDLSLTSDELFFNTVNKRGSFIFELGGRGVHSEQYGDHGVYALGLKKIYEKTQIHLSNKSGFKAPSVYQLYGEDSFGVYGNPELEPEKSITTELGIKHLFKNIESELVVFYSEVENFIDFGSAYENVNGSTTNGAELSLQTLIEKHQIQFNYTHIEYNLSTGKRPERRPSSLVNLNYNYSYNDLHDFGLGIRYRGKRYEDVDGVEEVMDEYTVVDANYRFHPKENYQFRLNVKNLTNESYELTREYNIQELGYLASLDYFY